MDRRIGPYRIQRQLGEGGMGVVYAAVDERLDRPVALKWMRETLPNPADRERFLREARTAASLSHPHICPIYALDEFDGRPYIAMELLEGRSLAERLLAGPIEAAEARMLMETVLEALGALHARGLVHRDLKPSNVFLTARGPMLLDFGLARDLRGAGGGLTRTGTLVGTPAYMSPEQALGHEVDQRTDVFAAGLLLYEMLSGRPAFGGDSAAAVLYSIVNLDPLPLEPSVAGSFSGVLERALAKRPADRYADATTMGRALARSVSETSRASRSSERRSITRLLALPLRVVRPDPDTDFLAYSLPDAAAASLASLESLVVRPSATAAKFAQHPLDLERIAREADVDVVLGGTLMRAGERVRVVAQLIEVPSGTLLVSHTCEAPLTDLFQLEDDLAHRVVDALRLPLTAREHRLLGRDVPADPNAYAAYLRANQLMTDATRWGDARDLYQDAVRADPSYAPAWARLGRAHRVVAKFGGDASGASGYVLAAEAFRRALELNPDLPAAHHLMTHLEVETGHALEAVERLLERVRQRPADPELYAGLVTACRFCGLLDESLRAYEIARRLDPFVSTSVPYTLFMRGEDERAMAADLEPPRFVSANVLAARGRCDEAVQLLREAHRSMPQRTLQIVLELYINAFLKDTKGARATIEVQRHTAFVDPEGVFLSGRALAFAGLHDEAMTEIERAVANGFACSAFLESDPWLEPLRGSADFARLVTTAATAHAHARAAFAAAGGERLLAMASR